MKRFAFIAGLAGCILGLILVLNSLPKAESPEAGEYVPNEVLLKFKANTDPMIMQNILASVQGNIITHLGAEISPAAWNAAAPSNRSFLLDPNTFHIRVPEGLGTINAMSALKTSPYIEYAEPNFIYHIAVDPNDTRFSELWGMKNTGQSGGTAGADIDAPAAWDVFTGSSDMVVAVIDSGICRTPAMFISTVRTRTRPS